MTRVLVFDGPRAPRRFELLRHALMGGGDGKGERVPATIRKEARLQDALDSISIPKEPARPGDDELRTLVSMNGAGPPSLTIAQEDFELLLSYAEKAPWTTRFAREAVDLWDWLSSAAKQE